VFSLDKLPPGCKPNFLAIIGYRWLITRIMIGAGLIKIRGDPCWLNLTCMNYFFETQPNPNPLSYFAHAAPEAWHKFETIGNHLVELVFPCLAFIPFRIPALINGSVQILFQVILIATGNLSFLNWLTILPSIWFLDDHTLSSLFSQGVLDQIKNLELEPPKTSSTGKKILSWAKFGVSLSVGGALAYLSIPIVQVSLRSSNIFRKSSKFLLFQLQNLLSSRQAMNTSFEPFRLVNTYGAFGHVTKERTEIILEGTWANNPNDPKAEWFEYEFRCKPGNLTQIPCLISPYHYRLDWLMWFAAFQDYQHNPWLIHLVGKMLTNDPVVDSLLAKNPFVDTKPPKFVRGRHFKYNFAPIGSSEGQKGQWWTRTYIKEYLPALDIKTLEPIYEQFQWKLIFTVDKS
jgi:hypothetical protein